MGTIRPSAACQGMGEGVLAGSSVLPALDQDWAPQGNTQPPSVAPQQGSSQSQETMGAEQQVPNLSRTSVGLVAHPPAPTGGGWQCP